MNKILQGIIDTYGEDDELLIADGFDDAIMGIEMYSNRIVYSISKCIKILQKGGMSREEAIDYFHYNVAGSFVGDKTPIWCDNDF